VDIYLTPRNTFLSQKEIDENVDTPANYLQDAAKKKYPFEPHRRILKTTNSAVPDQLGGKKSTEEWSTCERMAKMLEDKVRKQLQARRDKLEEYRQEWIKNAPEMEQKGISNQTGQSLAFEIRALQFQRAEEDLRS
jgi:hypothetical protein